MAERTDPSIDRALIEACRLLIQKHKKASESLVMNDAILDELVTLVRPKCNWSRDRIRTRVISIRKNPPNEEIQMPKLRDLLPPGEN